MSRPPAEEEGSFAAGRQALLDALQDLEQRTNERTERSIRDAEQRATQIVGDAEQRARQISVEAAQRVADLEQSLSEVRDNLEAARSQLEEQFLAVRGLLDVARANLNAVRERSIGHRPHEPRATARVAIPPLSITQPGAAQPTQPPAPAVGGDPSVAPAGLNDLRAAVDALKRPRRPDAPAEQPDQQPEEARSL